MIIVFLGPTLSLAVAKQILPQAIYMPPAKCGDVLQVTRLQPKTIVLIDGYFETTGAVWHKEILFALEQGIAVWGSSSMGALRARELAAFGMRGVGQIVAQYFKSEDQDDAVAVLHGPSEENYATRSEARINMTYLLNRVKAQGIITAQHAHLIQTEIENTFYPDRSWDAILDQVSSTYLIDFTDFKKWLVEHKQKYDLKKTDAIALLKTITKENKIVSSPGFKMSRSAFFRAQYKSVMCQPLAHDVDGLPIEEKLAIKTKKLGELYRDLRRLARVLAAAFALIKGNPRDGAEARFAQLQQAVDAHAIDTAAYLKNLLCLTLLPQEIIDSHAFAKKFPLRYQVLEITAKLWGLVDLKANALHLIPHPKAVQKYSEKFRLQKNLMTIEDTHQWLKAWGLDNHSFSKLMQAAAGFHYLITQNNLDSLGIIDTIENVCWYHDAMKVSGIICEFFPLQ